MPCAGGCRHTDTAGWVKHFSPEVFGPSGCPHCGFVKNTISGAAYRPGLPCPSCGRGVTSSAMTGFKVPPFCNYDDLLKQKAYLGGPWAGLRQEFASCDKLTASQKAAFAQDDRTFQAWFRADLPLCDADEQIGMGLDLIAKMHKWYGVLKAAGCTGGVPEPDPPAQPPKPGGGGLLGDTSGFADAAKWVAIAVGVGAAAYMIGPLRKGK